MSLDGYIAGPDDEFDWIGVDPDIDFEELFAQFDTFLLGRRTFEVTGDPSASTQSGTRTFVFSRTLSQDDYEDVTIVGGQLGGSRFGRFERSQVGDIWLFRPAANCFAASARKGSSTRWKSRLSPSCSVGASLLSRNCPRESG